MTPVPNAQLSSSLKELLGTDLRNRLIQTALSNRPFTPGCLCPSALRHFPLPP